MKIVHKFVTTTGFIIFALIFGMARARAGDEGLYAPPPPPGSAFVRFINGNSGASLPTTIRGQTFHTAAAGDIGGYVPVQHGSAIISLGTGKTTADLKTGAYYSAVLSKDGKLVVLEEPAFDPKLKAQLVLINLTPAQDLSLKTSDGTVAIIDQVKPGTLGARAVNALKAGFTIDSGAQKLSDLAPRPLERGASYAVVVYNGPDGKPVVNYDKAATP